MQGFVRSRLARPRPRHPRLRSSSPSILPERATRQPSATRSRRAPASEPLRRRFVSSRPSFLVTLEGFMVHLRRCSASTTIAPARVSPALRRMAHSVSQRFEERNQIDELPNRHGPGDVAHWRRQPVDVMHKLIVWIEADLVRRRHDCRCEVLGTAGGQCCSKVRPRASGDGAWQFQVGFDAVTLQRT